MFQCEWNECDSTFLSIIDLERHVKRHIDLVYPDDNPLGSFPSSGLASVLGSRKNSFARSPHGSPPSKALKFDEIIKYSPMAYLHDESDEQYPNQHDKHYHDEHVEQHRDKNSSFDQLVDDNDDDIVCCICDDGTEYNSDLIVLCDSCDLPFHQKCHQPSIPDTVIKDESREWLCSNCIA